MIELRFEDKAIACLGDKWLVEATTIGKPLGLSASTVGTSLRCLNLPAYNINGSEIVNRAKGKRVFYSARQIIDGYKNGSVRNSRVVKVLKGFFLNCQACEVSEEYELFTDVDSVEENQVDEHPEESVHLSELRKCTDKEYSGGCSWGKCEECGVPTMIIKLATGKAIEGKLTPGLACEIYNAFVE